jgi:hypothetical protein
VIPRWAVRSARDHTAAAPMTARGAHGPPRSRDGTVGSNKLLLTGRDRQY